MACADVAETAVLEPQHGGTRRLRCNINVIETSHAGYFVIHAQRRSCHVVIALKQVNRNLFSIKATIVHCVYDVACKLSVLANRM